MSKKVYIQGNDWGSLYAQMFKNMGWKVVDSLSKADMIQFCGGADVSPHLYGQHEHSTTQIDPFQDADDVTTFSFALGDGIPCAGICRGGQFLHVMNGGEMYQDVDHHAIFDTHKICYYSSNLSMEVTSTHHQMMKYDGKGILIGWASESTYRDSCSMLEEKPETHTHLPVGVDPEIIFHDEMGIPCLCFQPHPEYNNSPKEATNFYFALIEDYLFGEEK